MSAGQYNPGDIFLERYRIERVLGAGAMGIVIAAVHLGLAQRVAIKFMLPGKAPEEQHQRFLREARACAALKTPHATKVIDVGTTPEGAPYMVMEYLDGRDLAAELAARGPLPFDEAVELILQACEAIAEAHAAGIVHRDIKPANMFIARDQEGVPCVKVLDFGISKVSTSLALTTDVQTLGSPLYMSPEQMNSSKDVDARTDVWAIGASLYELVAGKTPFHATKLEELCTRVYFKPPTPLSTHRSDIPPGFEGVLFQCFEKERERRYPNVAALAAALAPFGPPGAADRAAQAAKALGMAPVVARPTNLLPAEPAPSALAVTGGPLARSANTPALPRARTPLIAVLGVVVGALALVGGVVFLRAGSPGTPAGGSQTSAIAPSSISVPPAPSAIAPAAAATSSAGPIPSITPSATVAVSATAPTPPSKVPPAWQPTRPTSKPRSPTHTPSLYGSEE